MGEGLRVPAASAAEHLLPQQYKTPLKAVFYIAAGQGLEPQYLPPEGNVLPLDEPAMNLCIIRNCGFFSTFYPTAL